MYKIASYILIVLFLVQSCKADKSNSRVDVVSKNEIEAIIENNQQAESIKETVLDFGCSTSVNNLTTSFLKKKIEKLSDLDNNYEVKSIAKIEANASFLFTGMKNYDDRNYDEYQLRNWKDLPNRFHEVNRGFVKGTKNLGGLVYARAEIEEYIFKSASCAENFMTTLAQAKGKGLWEYINKSPSDYFIEENRIYIIVSGGFYMMEFYEEIADKMQE